MSDLARPKPAEDEEELLKQQEEFLKKNVKPSATIVNKRKGEDQKVSKFASSSKKKGKIKSPSGVSSSVLGEVKEKIPDFTNWSFSNHGSQQGFPEVFSSDEALCGKGCSIFSEQLHERQQTNIKKNSSANVTQQNIENILGSKSFIISGTDALKIHQQNVEKLESMSVEEILAEQEKLKNSFDPKLLEFIRSLRQANKKIDVNLEMEVDRPTLNNSEGSSSDEPTNENNEVHDSQSESQIPEILQNEANKWLHMDVVEEDKLHWVGDIPSAKPVGTDEEYTARFNFQGFLMPYMSEEVDVRQGLYNHGDEPQRPGYSTEELYKLSRSAVLQQRVLALNIIANILEKTKKGYYDECLSEGLLSRLLDHELFLLLRFSLDENTETQLVATLAALKNLLCSEIDELCLDRTLGCSRSIWQPSLCVVEGIPQGREQELKDTEAELKDYQVLKLDIVKGALRSDLILRIRYILEVLHPCPRAVISCLEILGRLARHSYDTALAVTCCPRLLQYIITNFVPKDWTAIVGDKRPSDMQSAYGVPLVEALKLLRIVACQSRKMASDLVHKYSVMNSVISYISVDPRECLLPFREVLRLSLESLYIWQTFLAYNLATQHFIDLHPILMRLMQFHYEATSVDENSSSFGHDHGVALICLVEQAVHAAHHQETSSSCSMPKILKYHHVRGYSDLLETCVSKWLTQLGSAEELTFSAMKLVGATLSCLAAFYSCHMCRVDVDAVSWLSNLETLHESKILPFLKSQRYRQAFENLRNCSCLLFTGELGSKRDPSPLPSLGALMWKGECLTPVLQPNSPIPLLHGLSTYLLASYTAHKGLDSKYADMLLGNPVLLDYVGKVGRNATARLASHWFTRLEVNMLSSFLRLAVCKGFYNGTFHHLAFKLVTLIQRDEKPLVRDIMAQVVFSGEFFRDCSVICEKLAALQLKDSAPSDHVTRQELILKSCNELPMLWSCYKECLGLDDDPPTNDNLDIIGLTATKRGTDLLLPVDWPYLPIMHLHSQDKSSQKGNNESTSQVIRALQWVLLVEHLCPDVAAEMCVADRFCRLSTVFLSGSDLFLDPHVHGLLRAALSSLLQDYQKINFPASFYDLYAQLLEQFAAVSYGDALFGHFLLVPLQQRHNSSLRKQVWSEHAAVLRILSTPVNQLLFPLSEMLEPCETDSSLLSAYLHCLATGLVRETWCPVLHLVAVHHVSTFICLHHTAALAEQLRLKIMRLGNKELQTLLLNYCKT